MNFNKITDEYLIAHRKEICAKLKDRRELLGWSQEDLAEKMDISRSTVSKIENGEWNFGISYFIMFCNALDLTIELF